MASTSVIARPATAEFGEALAGEVAREMPADDRLRLQARFFTILGLALSSWAMVGGVAGLLL